MSRKSRYVSSGPKAYVRNDVHTTPEEAVALLQNILTVYMDCTYKLAGGATAHSCTLQYRTCTVSEVAPTMWDAIRAACRALMAAVSLEEAIKDRRLSGVLPNP